MTPSPSREGCFSDAQGVAAVLLLVLLACFLLLAPFMLSGVVRLFTDWRLPFALLVSVMLCYAATVVFFQYARLRQLLRRARPADYLLAVLGGGLLVGFTCWCLANRYLGGLSYYRGTDGSFHAHMVDEFASNPTSNFYGGFIIFHALAFWFERLFDTNRFWSFVFVYYAEVALTALIAVTLAAHAVSDARRWWSRGGLLLVTLAALLAVELVSLLPQQHMYQTDGFFPQLFALFPLLLIWAADSLIQQETARTLALIGLIGLYRYTYALNLADLLGVLALVAGFHCVVSVRWRRRLLWGGLYFGAMLVGTRAFYIVWRLRRASGHFVPFDWQTACYGQVLAIVMLIAAYFTARPHSRLRRICRIPILLGLVNLPLALSMRFWPPALDSGWYYGMKYTFHGFFLVGTAAAVVAPAAAHAAWTRYRSVFLRLGLGLPFLVAFGGVVHFWEPAFQPYQKGFIERAFKEPPYTENSPLADVSAIPRIQSVLRAEHKGFGGYIVSNFGMMMFMNAVLDHPYFGWGLWFGQALYEEAGRCIFWDEGSSAAWPVWDAWFAQKHKQRELALSHDKICVNYVSHWNPQGPPRRLCHRCN